jgi:hypothetical protein
MVVAGEEFDDSIRQLDARETSDLQGTKAGMGGSGRTNAGTVEGQWNDAGGTVSATGPIWQSNLT